MKKPITEKLHPESIDKLILPNRLMRIVSGGINCNLMFYSNSPGTGKSSSVKIMIKDHEYFYLNASANGQISYLNTSLKQFCENASISFDGKPKTKVVYLEELDRSSSAFQDGLKSFMDEHKNVYYIATTNHIAKIDKYVLSRFTHVDFTPQMGKERNQMKKKFAERMDGVIELLKMDFDDESRKMIHNIFPDYRSAYNTIEGIYRSSGSKKITTENVNVVIHEYMDIYDLMINNPDPVKIHREIMNYAGNEIQIIKALHTHFIDWLVKKKPDFIEYIGHINIALSIALSDIEKSIDPILHLKSCIYKISTILTK